MSNDIKNISENDDNFKNNRLRSFLYVWIAAVIGILFFIPAIPTHIPANVRLPFSMNTLIIIQIMLLVISTAIFAAAGAYLTPRVGFKAYLAGISLKNIQWIVIKRQFYYGVPIGLAGAIIAYLIAPDFISYLNSYPILSRLFGGIYEEVIMRWGLMTIMVWILWRIFQHGRGIPNKVLIYSVIFLSQILFAYGHMPALKIFGITDPIWSVFTIFVVSLPWGWLFWKQGLESAFIAHASFHAFIVLFVAVKL